MTNVLDALTVYTNVAFQLMAGEAGRFAKAFELPIPVPIPPAAVSRFELPQTSTLVEGSITVSNFTFKFDDGYLQRFYHERDSVIFAHNPLIMSASFQIFRNVNTAGPLTHKGEKGFRTLGATDAQLATRRYGPLTNRPAPRIFASWRADNSNLMVEGVGTNEAIVGAFVSATNLQFGPLTISNLPPTIRPTMLADHRLVECGAANATEGETRAVTQVLFTSLKRRLGSAPLKAVLANDNLNQPHVIADEIRKLAGDIPHAIVSATWQNPPSFPPVRLEHHARTNRGLQMLFVAGNIKAHVMPAPFLTGNPAQPDGQEPNMAAAALELARKYNLAGPQSRNLLFGLPRAPFLAERLGALGRDSASVIMPIGELSTAYTRTFVATVNGSARTNEPIAILLTGLFDREELFGQSVTTIATAGVYAPGFIVRFGENRLISTFESIGELGIKILEEARDAEIFRLWSQVETPPANAEKLDDYRIKKVGAKGGPDVARTLADEILAPDGGGSGGMTACLVDPGLAFRVSTGDGAVSAVVCFNCGQIHFVVRDRDGKEVHGGMRYIEAESKARLAKAGLKGLPGDRALIKITDHAR